MPLSTVWWAKVDLDGFEPIQKPRIFVSREVVHCLWAKGGADSYPQLCRKREALCPDEAAEYPPLPLSGFPLILLILWA
jgi:hypothetical protein